MISEARPEIVAELALEPLSDQAEHIVWRFEQAWGTKGAPPELRAFVAEAASGESARLLEELVRVDMEIRANRGKFKTAAEYWLEYPELQALPGAIQRLVSEESRLSKQLGRPIDRSFYAANFGMELPQETDGEHDEFPKCPGQFLGFELVGILGQGASGRVYLARQDDLARRFVVLKVSRDAAGEAFHLAKLQHTHIVPVYSMHRAGVFQAMCMPYLGLMTLADVLSVAGGQTPLSAELVSTVAARKCETLQQSLGQSLRNKSETLKEISWPTSSEKLDDAWKERHGPMAIAWIGRQVADGLAFAHQLGVVHGDVKPANILISDSGQPLLLDFHLATTQHYQNPEALGGTLPYMAPEHLAAYRDRTSIDARSDLYSLGVVLFQMVTGELPFPTIYPPDDAGLNQMIADRQQGPPERLWQQHNIPIDLASIVAKLLHPDANQRYSSAAAVKEDLDCFLAFRPLRFARNRRLRTRLANWCRRHPRITSATSVASVAFIILMAITSLLVMRSRHLNQMQALSANTQLVTQLRHSRLPLTVVDLPENLVRRAADRLREHVDQVTHLQHVRGEPLKGWRRLAAEEQQALRGELVASYSLLTSFELRLLDRIRAPDRREEILRRVDEYWNRAVEWQDGRMGPASLLQSATIAEFRGDKTRAAELKSAAFAAVPNNTADRVLMAHEYLTAGDVRAADSLLQAAIDDAADSFEAWLLLGNVRALTGDIRGSEACYSMCVGLAPDSDLAHFNRGRARLDLSDWQGAVRDFSTAIRVTPNEPTYFANRALGYMGAENWQAAVDDLTNAIELGAVETRLWALRADVYEALGKEALAHKDRDRFMKLEPVDADSWVTRALAHYSQGDVAAALDDLDQAIVCDPDSLEAWQNKAALLALDASQTPAAIDAMTEVIELRPQHAASWATRGVLQARRGERQRALQDAEAALALDNAPDTRYRVAGIYALTSQLEPSDAHRAMQLLQSALAEDPQLVFHYFANDPDLAPLAGLPEFQEFAITVQRLRDWETRIEEHHQP